MKGFAIQFETEGIAEVAAMFDEAVDRSANVHQPLGQSSQLLLKTFDMNFDSRGNTLSEPWAPRKEAYDWPALQKTGEMRNSFGDMLGNDFVTIFNTRQPVFMFHQKGTKNMPKRVLMKIDDLRRQQIVKFFQQWIMGQK